jgi:hypothetical protein
LAVVLNTHLVPEQSAVTCISIWVAGSTGIEVVAELDAAEADALGVSTAASSAPALAAVIRFIVRKVSLRYSS